MLGNRHFEKRSGFTIVELLIVIVIIAILAVIVIVAFNGMQTRARTSSVTSDLSAASRKFKSEQIINGTYPTSYGTSSSGTTFQVATNNTASPQTFCITGTNGTISYKVTQDTNPAPGGCAGHGIGGQDAITNLALNPSYESDIGSTSNVGSTGGTVTASNERAWSGSNSMKMVGASGRKTMTSAAFATNETVYWSFWLYSSNISITITPYWEAGSPYTGGPGGSARSIPANTWTKVTGSTTFTSTHSASSNFGFGFLRNGTPTSDPVYLDGTMITRENTSTFADGSTTNWIWNGTPNNSTSTGPAV